MARRNLKAWRAKVLARDRGCKMCGYCKNEHYLSAHHLIFLSRCAKQYETDPRNGLILCNGFANGCHEAVHALRRKIPLSILPPEVVVCLAEQGLHWVDGCPEGTLARYFDGVHGCP